MVVLTNLTSNIVELPLQVHHRRRRGNAAVGQLPVSMQVIERIARAGEAEQECGRENGCSLVHRPVPFLLARLHRRVLIIIGLPGIPVFDKVDNS